MLKYNLKLKNIVKNLRNLIKGVKNVQEYSTNMFRKFLF